MEEEEDENKKKTIGKRVGRGGSRGRGKWGNKERERGSEKKNKKLEGHEGERER